MDFEIKLQNPGFRINSENFHPYQSDTAVSLLSLILEIGK